MKLSTHSKLLVAALGVLALVVAVAVAIRMTGQRSDDSAQRSSDTGSQAPVSPVDAHLQQFQTLADEHGDRAAGTPGYEAAAQYVEQQLASAGYQSRRQYFTFEHRGEEIESFNIIAETAGGDDDNVIMLGAHLDGVPDSPAINDNASGVAALLEAATQLSNQDGITNKVRFAWWGAEEIRRTPGSRHYVDSLTAHDPDELDRITAYINIDMIASPNYVIGVYDARESDPGTAVPDGSVAVMDILTDYFDAREQRWSTTHWNFASDQVAFTEADVAVGGLFTGSSESKSRRDAALFGGTAGQPRDPNYHTSGDDIGNIDEEALNIMTGAISDVADRLAQEGLTSSGNTDNEQEDHRSSSSSNHE